MKPEIKALQDERNLIKDQLYRNLIPNRLTCSLGFKHIYLMQSKGIDPIQGQYDFSLLRDAAHELCESIYTDTCPVAGIGTSSRLPSNMQLLDSKTMVMGSDGFMQHPNVVGMNDDEYDELINDPYAFIVDKVIPRLYPGLPSDNGLLTYRDFYLSDESRKFDASVMNGIVKELVDEFGYFNGAVPGAGGFSEAPFDFLADQMRSFSETMIDVRRRREQVKEACEALLPLMFKLGMPANVHYTSEVSTPLHMAMYMRLKDVEELWLPTFKTLSEQYAARGVRVSCFCEQDWTKLYDVLSEFPTGQHCRFEIADIKDIKQKFGKKFMIGTNYPINLLRYGTAEENIKATRQMLDDTMEGGGITFDIDKGSFTYGGINFENAKAVMDTVHTYGVYKDGGQPSSLAPLNSENFTPDRDLEKPLRSKYAFNWDEFHEKYPQAPEHIRARFEANDAAVMKRYLLLLG